MMADAHQNAKQEVAADQDVGEEVSEDQYEDEELSTYDPDSGDDSEMAPFKRVGYGERSGGPSRVTQQVVDRAGNMMNVIDDEVDLPEDLEGESKVSKLGQLQGGREYRCRTFTVLGRGERLYMLSTEPARCVGLRDSHPFFNRHKKLCKVSLDDDERSDLIERGIIPKSYKGRMIGVVTARSVFREFGARIIVGGLRVTDDYEVAKAWTNGVPEGKLADPEDVVVKGQPYNTNKYVAWHGASSVYHSAKYMSTPNPSTTAPKPSVGKQNVVDRDDPNWMLEQCKAARYEATRPSFRRQLTPSQPFQFQAYPDAS
jgi:chromatin structure-remodeling complex protein RSC7